MEDFLKGLYFIITFFFLRAKNKIPPMWRLDKVELFIVERFAEENINSVGP